MNAVWNLREKIAVEQMLKYTFVGSKETVKEELTDFVAKTAADEIMTATYIYDHDQRLKSHRLLSEIMNSQ
jgi:alkanesulfonate monooxygenase SsuD/methylene tetrahydromethanopterin reductase-like flavin-dependent oxidoreductase (luciferase family)